MKYIQRTLEGDFNAFEGHLGTHVLKDMQMNDNKNNINNKFPNIKTLMGYIVSLCHGISRGNRFSATRRNVNFLSYVSFDNNYFH